MRHLIISPTARSLAFGDLASPRRGASVARHSSAGGNAGVLVAVVLLLLALPILVGGGSSWTAVDERPAPMASPAPAPDFVSK